MGNVITVLEEALVSAINFWIGNFWQLLVLIVLLARRELRFLGLLIAFIYAASGDAPPTWVWVIVAILAIIIELDEAGRSASQ